MKAQLATTQKQGLSFLLKRSLELFQWPFDELQRFVHEQAESNPFLSLPETSSCFDVSMQNYAAPLSIRETLFQQISSWPEKEVAKQFIDLLDEDGYFRESLEDLEKTFYLTRGALETFIQKLQTLEPAGVFARNLAECYALQLQDLGEWTEEWALFLGKLHHPLAALAAEFSINRVRVFIKRLKYLSPYPAKECDEAQQMIVIPDLVASYENNEWTCEINPYTALSAGIQTEYLPFISRVREDEQKTLKEQFKSAKWLCETLSRRAHMLKKVGLHILEHQTNFFMRGAQGLKPLTLKHVALAVEVHESTISRIIRHKYVQTERGTFPLKFFFNQAVHANVFSWEEEKMSAHHIQDHIRRLIEKEPHQAPYSDQKLVELLEAQGIPIARRTIAKYRLLQHVPSAAQRKALYGIQ